MKQTKLAIMVEEQEPHPCHLTDWRCMAENLAWLLLAVVVLLAL